MNTSITQEYTFKFTGREKLPLPLGYTPTNDVFIVGRGRKVYEHPGNQTFRKLIDATLPHYKQAPTKGLKSAILWQVLQHVRSNSTNGLGFVKKEAGRWHALDDSSARINIAQAFRDRLTTDYRSSKKHKSIKRKVDLGIPLSDSDEITANSYNSSDSSNCSSICGSDDEEDRPTKCRRIVNTTDKLSDLSNLSVVSGLQMRSRQELLQHSCSVRSSAKSYLYGKLDAVDASKTFENLFLKFGKERDDSENPFEPNPIAPEPLKELRLRGVVCNGTIREAIFPSLLNFKTSQNYHQYQLHPQDDFEPLPVSVDETYESLFTDLNVGEQLQRRSSISDLSVNKNIFDVPFDNILEAALSS